MRSLRRFRDAEDGSLLILGLFLFIVMLLLGGIAIDLVRFEERRTRLQNTIDRAVLAAADLGQTIDPETVVKDYFRAAGLNPPKSSEIKITDDGVNDYRKVEIGVRTMMPTMFMKLAGVPSLSTPVGAGAEEGIGEIEISLVLDVSGSMNSNNRLIDLKPAAKAFVDQMFDSTDPGNLTISIIPYATQVSIGNDIARHLNLTNEHSDSTCVEFDPAKNDFGRLSLDMKVGLSPRVYQRNGHFDPFYASSPPVLLNCDNRPSRDIIPFSDNRNALKAYIDAMVADGNTSIDLGMKWGAALLDPSTRQISAQMINDGKIDAGLAGRPLDYNNKKTMKVIVLMTDGENTTEYKLKNNTAYPSRYFDEGTSPLVRNPWYRSNSTTGDDYDISQYSLWDASRRQYFIFAKNIWRKEPWGEGSTTTTTCSTTCTSTTAADPGASLAKDSSGKDVVVVNSPAVSMSWQQVWKTMSINYYATWIVGGAYGSAEGNRWKSGASNPVANTHVGPTPKNASVLSLCDAAKAQGVSIYSIAFDAPANGQNLLKACQNSGYFAVSGGTVGSAFAGIANAISKLRLTN